jgi:hypothetical protein
VKRLFLVVALLASATAASGSVIYSYHATSFGTTDWQFTVLDFLSAPGTTFITSFDSASSSFLGTILDVQIFNPFSASPGIQTDGTGGGLGIGAGYPGPFDHDGTYSITGATLTISGAPSAPEPSPLALTGVGGILLALVRRRHWISQKQIAN